MLSAKLLAALAADPICPPQTLAALDCRVKYPLHNPIMLGWAMLGLRLTSFVSECCKADRSQMSGYGQPRNPLIQGAPWALITEKTTVCPRH